MLPGFPIAPEDSSWSFEGAPLSDGAHLYVAMRHERSVRPEAHVACFDLQTGELQWRQLVAAAETFRSGSADEITQNLLTLDGQTLYYNTNLGAVAALATDSGAVRWLLRYPRSTSRGLLPEEPRRHWFRDLTPCLVYRDLVVVAPADCDRLFALDAATGLPLWVTRPGRADDAVHLLGVADDQLLVSGDFLYWFDVYRGTLRAQFPAPRRVAPGHALPSPRGYGRGLLAGDKVLWPSENRIYVFYQQLQRARAGWQPVVDDILELRRLGLTGGNLLASGDLLLLATADHLSSLNLRGVSRSPERTALRRPRGPAEDN